MANEGNKWWKLRATSGREKIFSTPEDLWKAACEYFEATDARKWKKKDWVGKDAEEVERESETPYTWTGLALFLDIDTDTLRNYGKEEGYKDFFGIISRIGQIIYTQKIEGASVGAFNPSIVARELGLAEKTDVTNKTFTVTVADDE
jgi:hypothetical protein